MNTVRCYNFQIDIAIIQLLYNEYLRELKTRINEVGKKLPYLFTYCKDININIFILYFSIIFGRMWERDFYLPSLSSLNFHQILHSLNIFHASPLPILS